MYLSKDFHGNDGVLVAKALTLDFYRETAPQCWRKVTGDNSKDYEKIVASQSSTVESQIEDIFTQSENNRTPAIIGFSWSNNVIIEFYFYYDGGTPYCFHVIPNYVIVTSDSAKITYSANDWYGWDSASFQQDAGYEAIINEDCIFVMLRGTWTTSGSKWLGGVFTTLNAPFICKYVEESTTAYDAHPSLAFFWGKQDKIRDSSDDRSVYLLPEKTKIYYYDRINYLYDIINQNRLQIYTNKKFVNGSGAVVGTVTSLSDCTQASKGSVIETSNNQKYFVLDSYTMVNIDD